MSNIRLSGKKQTLDHLMGTPANFHGVNTPTTANSKIPVWCPLALTLLRG